MDYLSRWSLARVTIVVWLHVLTAGVGLAEGADPKSGSENLIPQNSKASRSSRITLIWHDAYKLLPKGYKTMCREVHRVFSELGIEIDWEKGRHQFRQGVDSDPLRINVVLLPSSSRSWGFEGRVMGVATHREGAKGAIYLFHPEVLRTLNLDRSVGGLRTPRAVLELARALGRVVAHELVHVMAPHHPHTGMGLMHGSLTRRFLRTRHVHLDASSALAFVTALEAKLDEALVASTPGLAGEKLSKPGG